MNRRQFVTMLTVSASCAVETGAHQRNRKRSQADTPLVGIPGAPHQPASDSLLFEYTRAFTDYDRLVVRKGHLGGSPRVFQTQASGVVSGDGLEAFRAVWSQLLGASAAACWNPGFELAFIRGSEQSLSAQICFHCRIIAFGSLETAAGFDANGDTGFRLQQLLDRIASS